MLCHLVVVSERVSYGESQCRYGSAEGDRVGCKGEGFC